jgi:uncharacterized protein (DUF58 family)
LTQSKNISELIKKVRQIEIKTKGLSNHIFSGEYSTAFKGRGMSFSEVRAYQYGDDVRSIDWNVTARYADPHIKIFEEERELTLLLLVDVSASSLFGTSQKKRDTITEICATLAFSALGNNDKVGVIFFSNTVEKFIPPKKGKGHILYIIRELLTVEASPSATKGGAKTNIEEVLRYTNNVIKKRSIAFLLSDFISPDFSRSLRIAKKRHDIIGVHVYDPRDKELPNVGLVKVQDSENGEEAWLDTSLASLRKFYTERFEKKALSIKDIFKKSGADLLSISTADDYVKPLKGFFKSR